MTKRRTPAIPSKGAPPKPPANPAAEGPQVVKSPEQLAIEKYQSMVLDQSEQLFDARVEVQRVTQFNINANAEIKRLKAENEKLKAKAPTA